jgi:hypothetical protein
MSFSQSVFQARQPQFSQAPDFQPYQYAQPKPLSEFPQEQPGLMSLLAQSAGSGLGQGVATGIQKQMKQAVLEKALGQVKPNMSALERAQILGQLEPEQQNLLNPIFQGEADLAKEQRQRVYEQQKAAQAHQYARALEQEKGANRLEQIRVKPKKGAEEEFSPEEQEKFQGIFNKIGELAPKLGYQKSLIPSKEFLKARGELNALRLNIVQKARKLENTGHLTKEDMKRVFEAIPNADDTEATFRGKMEGLATIFDLQPPTFEEQVKGKPKFLRGKQSAQSNELPPATGNTGRTIVNSETGERLISNGSGWVKG